MTHPQDSPSAAPAFEPSTLDADPCLTNLIPQGPAPGDARPRWDDWFMMLAEVVSWRSPDPSTKHGCVLVGAGREVLSVGYNAPPRGCYDSQIPNVRPDKYLYYAHSEENAIANAARAGIRVEGATAYVTGRSCTQPCFRMLINAGVSRLVQGPRGSACVDEEVEAAKRLMLKNRWTPFYVEDYPHDPRAMLLERLGASPATEAT